MHAYIHESRAVHATHDYFIENSQSDQGSIIDFRRNRSVIDFRRTYI